jgi:chromosome condensin MukBEF ATPase and DNA-binding subunit MukB
MSNKNTKNEQSNASNLKVGDEFIAVIRELVQLSLLTGTNVVDHLRAVRVEVIDGTVVPTEQYVQEYNAYIEQLEAAAAKLQEEMQAQEALDDAPAN